MKSAGRAAIVVLSFLLAASCVPRARTVSFHEPFLKPDAGRKAWRRVAVLPFAGEPAIRRIAAEWFAFRLRKQGLFEIVDPSLAEIELGKTGARFGDAAVGDEEARRAGQRLGVDGVVSGSVGPIPARGGTPAVGARMIDVATGTVVADGAESIPVLVFRYSQDVVLGGVARIADGFAPALFAAAGKPWTPPPERPKDGQDAPPVEPGLR